MSSLVKICGLSTPDTLDAALEAGADMIGLVHFPRSPRHVGIDEAAALSARAKGRALRTLLVVDPDDALLDLAVAAADPDWLQLHGRENPERVAAIRARYGRPVMKAIGIAEAADLAGIGAYDGVADRILLDAKPPCDATLPGGNGLAFDWRLIAGLERDPRFMLSGGLSPGNVAEAIATTGVAAVDVSSGVEDRPGHKNPDRIRAFLQAARAAFAAAPGVSAQNHEDKVA